MASAYAVLSVKNAYRKVWNLMQNKILFTAPGEFDKWEQQCQPIGNGYMGASFFGGISKEKIVLNEKTLWAGGPSESRPDYNSGIIDGSYEYVKQVQQLLYDGKYDEAVALLPHLTGATDGFGAYQLLCNMMLTFSNIDETQATDYTRTLDLDNSIFTTQFTYQGAVHKREAFANYPSNVICLKLSSDKPRRICAKLSLDNLQCGSVTANGDTLTYEGALWDNGLRYCTVFKVVNKGGELIDAKDSIMVEHADEVYIYLTASTDYSNKYPTFRTGVNPSAAVNQRIENAVSKGFDALYEEHLADYKALFDRVTLKINEDTDDIIPCDKLISEYKENGSRSIANRLETLYFQFGRYMLISSSRAGSLPANLQGVWNESNCPPWCCDYHINVNLQMNYWGAYNTNLSETVPPLVDFLDSMRPSGRKSAEAYYGIKSDEEHPENGWCAHTQSTPFGWTAPGWDFYWGWSTAAVAWLMQNIYEYFEFTGDKEYFAEHIYPIMRESVRFYTQWLIYDDKQKRLVSSPTYSPEHGPVTIGNTYEQSLIEQLYNDFITASEALGTDEELRNIVKNQVVQLKPYSVSKKTGLLKEWFEEDDDNFDHSKTQKNHRHISHLLGLYPGKAINSNTPELMTAAINTLNDRGDESTGWARAYKLNLWARVKDGNRAYSILQGLLRGCTFDNLFDFHPPFQLDGNFGGSAGIAEMLIQSHEGYIELLPAAPDAWRNGTFTGLCARHGFVIDAKWENFKPTAVTIKSTVGGVCRIKSSCEAILCDGKSVPMLSNDGIVSFETQPDSVYTFVF